jgi:hypothetical protein
VWCFAHWCHTWHLVAGVLHGPNNKPAITYTDGHSGDHPDTCTQIWAQYGTYHRDGDMPCVVMADGSQEWYWCGRRHRSGDNPAVVRTDGTSHWFRYGLRHRDGDKPAIVHGDGALEWFRYGDRHRENFNPVIVMPRWFSNIHPAVIHLGEGGTSEWWEFGKMYRL